MAQEASHLTKKSNITPSLLLYQKKLKIPHPLNRSFFLILAITFMTLMSISQSQVVPVLERKINIDFENRRTADVLDSIEQLSGCRFSFNSSLVDENKLITIHLHYKTVREALDKIFKGSLQYKGKGDYIILTKAPAQPKVISGYVENNKGEKVAGASVYDASTMASATTNEYGYYEMKIKRSNPVALSVSKSNYADTVIKLLPSTPTLQSIVIEEKRDTSIRHMLRTVKDSVSSKLNAAGEWTVEQFTRNPNVENISDSIHREFQFSFVPFVGTNGRLSGNVTNDYSFNVIGGYNRGVKKAELAGMFNIDREDVGVVQFAGFSNIVGGSMTGAQFAGFNNINLKTSSGAQFAGFINVNSNGYKGAQFGGFANYTEGDLKGVSFAGFTNIVHGNVHGIVSSGFANLITGNVKGVQLSGFINLAADTLKGAQISGFMNVASIVKGAQIGVFNFADSLSGIPLGFISFVNHGYHKLELAYDELGYSNVSFRTGVHSFYNILTAGIQPKVINDTVDWTFGYGIGTSPKLANKLYLNVDLSSQQIVHGNVADQLNLLNKCYLGLDYQITKRISVTAGLVANGYITETGARVAPGSEDPHRFYTHPFNSNYRMESWFGWKAGIRFF